MVAYHQRIQYLISRSVQRDLVLNSSLKSRNYNFLMIFLILWDLGNVNRDQVNPQQQLNYLSL